MIEKWSVFMDYQVHNASTKKLIKINDQTHSLFQ